MELYRDEDVDVRRLYRELSRARARGAINDQRTEKGLTALGVAVWGPHGAAHGAMALAHADDALPCRPGPRVGRTAQNRGSPGRG